MVHLSKSSGAAVPGGRWHGAVAWDPPARHGACLVIPVTVQYTRTSQGLAGRRCSAGVAGRRDTCPCSHKVVPADRRRQPKTERKTEPKTEPKTERDQT